jgi:cell division protein FtsQ
MAVAAPEDRRFRRGRSVAVSPRRRRAARLAVVARVLAWAAAVGAFAGAGALAVQAASRLTVARIVVSGNEQMATGDVLAQIDGLVGQPIVALDLQRWQRQLERSPWVQRATLRRVLPDTVEVTLTERRPLAIGRVGTSLVLVDGTGTVIDEFGPNYEGFDLPIIDGLVQHGDARGPVRPAERAALVASLLRDLSADPALLGKVSQVDVADPENVVLWLDDDPVRLLVGDRDFRKRLTGYLEVRGAVRARVSEIEAVDLRFGHRVFVRPAGGGAAGRARPAPGATRARS